VSFSQLTLLKPEILRNTWAISILPTFSAAADFRLTLQVVYQMFSYSDVDVENLGFVPFQ
jgi:hypothetical protein